MMYEITRSTIGCAFSLVEIILVEIKPRRIGSIMNKVILAQPYILSKLARFFAAMSSLSLAIFKIDLSPTDRSISGKFTIYDKFVILFIIKPVLLSLHMSISGNNKGDITYISWKYDLKIKRENQIKTAGIIITITA